MSLYGNVDSQVFQNIAATPAAFALKGGCFGVTVHADTWGGGSVDLKRQAADGTTFISVLSAPFTADAYQVVNIPPGTYQLAVATATGVDADVTSVFSTTG
ncbi:hypothetical protein [Bradyrhizobium sp. th.b2]|uniref:hypothetical protein n=1 Tax=Bradyrhizobium sp. th-b2 TaxID=172088 RepID=UPI00041BDC17|nr:hypothetical protein [Bradyrhizobium sp. th.b2]